MFAVTQQVAQLIGKPLDLQDPAVLHQPRGPDDRVARTDQQRWIGIDRARAIPQPPDEAIMQAAEACFLRIAQIKIGAEPPDAE